MRAAHCTLGPVEASRLLRRPARGSGVCVCVRARMFSYIDTPSSRHGFSAHKTVKGRRASCTDGQQIRVALDPLPQHSRHLRRPTQPPRRLQRGGLYLKWCVCSCRAPQAAACGSCAVGERGISLQDAPLQTKFVNFLCVHAPVSQRPRSRSRRRVARERGAKTPEGAGPEKKAEGGGG